MSNRPKGYGLSGEVAARMGAKYTQEDEGEVVAWMLSILNDNDGPSETGRQVSISNFIGDPRYVRPPLGNCCIVSFY